VTNEVVRMRALNYYEEILKERRERGRDKIREFISYYLNK
jgi:hypothetical protein